MPLSLAEAQIVHREPQTAEGIAARVRRYRQDAEALVIPYHVQAQELQRYASLQQWPRDVEEWAKKNRIPRLAADFIGPLIGQMTGKQHMERLEPKILAEGDVAKGDAEAFAAYVKKVRELSKASKHERDWFRDLWVQGLSCLQIRVVFRNSQVPQVQFEVVPVWEMLWDPKSREQNLTDATWFARGRWADASETRRIYGLGDNFMARFKDKRDPQAVWPTDIRNSYKSTRDEIFIWTIEWRDVEPLVEVELQEAMDMKVVELVAGGMGQVQALKTVAMNQEVPFDPAATAATAELPWQLSQEEWEDFSQTFEAARGVPFGSYWKGERDVYWTATMVGDRLLRGPLRIPENGFTFYWLTDSMMKSAEGYLPISFVGELRDRQDFYNMGISGALETVMKESKAGYWHKANAIVDPVHWEESFGRPGFRGEVTSPPGEDWGEIPQTSHYEGYERAMEMAERFHRDVTLDPYSRGSVEDLRRTASSAVQQVTEHAAEKHAARWAALKDGKEEATRHLIRIAIANYDPRLLARLLGTKAIEGLSQDRRRWVETMRYAITVEESPYTAAERDRLFQTLAVDQGGLIRNFLGTPYDPGTEVFAEMLEGVSLVPYVARRLWQERLRAVAEAEKAAAQQPQPPPQPQG